MIRIAVCEDNLNNQKTIEECLNRYREEHQTPLEVVLYQDGIDLVSEYEYQFDVILMDIEMKMMDGLEASKKIRAKDATVIIIFITNLAQYAIQGYEVEAKGFLLKPVNYIALEQQLNKCVGEIEKKQEEYITVNVAGGVTKIPCSKITYMESEGHYIVIHTVEETYRTLSSIKEMESKLDEHFFRSNSGILVNLSRVESVKQNDVIIAGETLAISRSRKKAFMEALTDYIGGR